VKGKRSVSLNGTIIEAMIYERDRLDIARHRRPRHRRAVRRTTVIPPAWRARVDGYRNLILLKA